MWSLDEQNDYAFAEKYMNLFEKITAQNQLALNLTEVSRNPLITMTYVEQHPAKPWDWEGLTENPSVSIAYMKAHPEHPWDSITYYFREKDRFDWDPRVFTHSDHNAEGFPYAWYADNITLAEFEEHFPRIDDQADAIWLEISANPNLTLDFIEKYLAKPWKLSALAENPLTKAKKAYIQ